MPARVRGRTVTVGAEHLHAAAIRPEQIWLHVEIVVELDRSRIGLLRTQDREFRMIAFKIADVAGNARGIRLCR